jgi:RNA polymerase sigma factor (sigma-70 family)
MNENVDINQIIDGCKANKRVAQEQLYKMFYGKMLTVCNRYFNDKDTAQEVLQEGFIKVFEKIKSYDSTGSFDGWVRRIVANTAIDAIRKFKKDHTYVENDWQLGETNDDYIESQELSQLLTLKSDLAMEAIQSLSPAYKMVFNLYVFENYSHREIAEQLEISEGTSKSNFAKAKQNLQKMLTNKFVNLD